MSFIAPGAVGGSEALLLNATDYFANPDLSDVTIVVREEVSRAAQPMQNEGTTEPQFRQGTVPEARLPGHKIILSAYSSFFKTQLARWSGNNELELTVPPGQLAVAELLIRCIYEPQPNLAGCSQQQLIDLLQLADRHDVKKAVYAATNELRRIPVEQLEWGTAMAVFSLPPGCAELEAYRPVFAAAAARLLAELGDLEVDWQHDQKQQLLLSLPFPALLALLQDDTTRVASENTVAYTIQRWADYQQEQHKQSQQLNMPGQPEQSIHPSQEQLQQLAQQIRMRWCTQLYIATVMPTLPALQNCFTASEWLIACALGQHSSGNPYCDCLVPVTRPEAGACSNCGTSVSHSHETELLIYTTARRHPAVQRYPAWALGVRLKSALNHLMISWKLPVSEIVAAVDRVTGTEHTSHEVCGPISVWAGRCINVFVLVGRGMHVPRSSHHMMFLGIGMVGGGACSFEVRATAGNGSIGMGDFTCGRIDIEPDHSALSGDPFGIGVPQSGLECERKLRERQLVQPDDCIHLGLQLTCPVM